MQADIPESFDIKARDKCYPERMDDMTWGDDLVAFYAHDPASQAGGERGFGYDLFIRRDTSGSILEDMYAKETDKEARVELKELKKTEPEKAVGLLKKLSCHIDHGHGMDCYTVGSILGAGVATLMMDGNIIYP